MTDKTKKPDTILTAEQVDDLCEFVSAALAVANFGMNQECLTAKSKPGDPDQIRVTGTVFRETAEKALPHLGLSIKWTEPKAKKGRKRQ